MKHLHALLFRVFLIAMCTLAALAALVVTIRLPGLAAGIVCFHLWRKLRSWRGSGWAHGTSRYATFQEVHRARLLAGHGLILGTAELLAPPPRAWATRLLLNPTIGSADACEFFLTAMFSARWKCERLVRVGAPIHLLTVAGTGKGKSVSVFVPNLLAYPGAVVVVDPKCELFGKTAEHRTRVFRHRCYRLDPFGLDGTAGECLNPLSFIDPTSSDFLDACRDLASAMVMRGHDEREPHWNDSAEVILTAFIAYVSACETDTAARNLSTVRHLVASRSRYTQAVERMQQVQGFDGVIAKLGHTLTWFQGDELGSVLTHVQRHTAFLDSPDIAACVAASFFHPRDLRTGRVSVFLCLPPTRLRSLAPLQRMWIATILRVLAQGRQSEKHPVLFLIDEAAHIGHIQILEDAVTLMRGAGIRLWFAFQSLGQLKECYGERASVFLDNIDTQQYFGLSGGFESLEALSKRIGDRTILVDSLNKTTSTSRPEGGAATTQGGSVSTSTAITTSEHGRALLRPDEISRLDETTALVFHRNLPVIPVRLIKYFEFDGFKNGGTGHRRIVGVRGVIGAAAALVLCAVFVLQILRMPVRMAPPVPAAAGPGLPPTSSLGRSGPPYRYGPALYPRRSVPRPYTTPLRRGRLIRVQ